MYVTRAYPALSPHPKGMHLTLARWQAERDTESSWKLKTRQRAVEEINPISRVRKFGLVDLLNEGASEYVTRCLE
jgi:hypothetical protein